jgi:hypothetical protein
MSRIQIHVYNLARARDRGSAQRFSSLKHVVPLAKLLLRSHDFDITQNLNECEHC